MVIVPVSFGSSTSGVDNKSCVSKTADNLSYFAHHPHSVIVTVLSLVLVIVLGYPLCKLFILIIIHS